MTTKSRGRSLAVLCLAAVVFFSVLRTSAQSDQQQEKTKPEKAEKSYGLIFGTAYGPDDRPLYGVKVNIQRQGKKHGSWNLVSDHRGEFAQRVPVEAADYVIKGQAEYAPIGPDGKPQMSKKKKLKGEAKVHIEGEIRQDVGLHLTE